MDWKGVNTAPATYAVDGLIFLIREKISGSELSPRHHPGWDGMGARYFCDCGFPGQSMHNVF